MARDTTVKQLTLPGVDMRQVCPGCKRPASLLGQVYPGDGNWLCRDCIEFIQPDMAVFEAWDNRIGVRLRRENEWWPQRERYQLVAASLARLRKGCLALIREDWAKRGGLDCESDPERYFSNCRACRNRRRYETQLRRSSATHKAAIARGHTYNLSLPLCQRCGCAHERRTFSGDSATYCQRCDDEMVVEALVRWVFKIRPDLGEDDEAALDWLYQTGIHRGLFERGLLPDYWYKVRRGQ